MTDGASKLLPRRREPGGDPRPKLLDTAKAETRGATVRVAATAERRVRIDFTAFSQLQLELLPSDYFLG